MDLESVTINQSNWVQNPLRLSSLCKTWLINQIVNAGKARQLPSFRRILPYWASFIPGRNQTHMWFLDARKEGQLHLCPQVNRTFACTWRPWGLATGKHLKNRWSTPQLNACVLFTLAFWFWFQTKTHHLVSVPDIPLIYYATERCLKTCIVVQLQNYPRQHTWAVCLFWLLAEEWKA